MASQVNENKGDLSSLISGVEDGRPVMSGIDIKEDPNKPERPADLKTTAQLNPAEKEIRRLRDELAREKGKNLTRPGMEEEVEINPTSQGYSVLHFLEDGFTAAGRVFNRGDEFEFDRSDPNFQRLLDKRGNFWGDLSEGAQIKRYHRPMFAAGHWPHERYNDVAELRQMMKNRVPLPPGSSHGQ